MIVVCVITIYLFTKIVLCVTTIYLFTEIVFCFPVLPLPSPMSVSPCAEK
jgi:hypothetical protein